MKTKRLALASGVTLNVATDGPADAPPVILLHGFPESHRTWRSVAPLLADRFRLIMPDLRGYGASDKPDALAAYGTDPLLDDLDALADAFGLDRFALVGHDWGGAFAWAAAIRGLPRLTRLAIVNSPHPLIFQRAIIDDPAQRAASQYIRAFRDPGMEARIAAMGLDAFFDKSFVPHVDLAAIPADEKARYLADWGAPGALRAMLALYRASAIAVPAMNEEAAMPGWVARGVPRIEVPVRVIWGLKDAALLPCQLAGIEAVGRAVEVVELPEAGHFAPWQAPRAVADALRPFLAADGPSG